MDEEEQLERVVSHERHIARKNVWGGGGGGGGGGQLMH